MRILVVSQYFRPENFRVNDVVEGLLERGHAVTVLTGLPNYPSGRFADGYGWRGPYREHFGRAEVIRVPLVPRGRGGNLRLFLNYLSFTLFASLLGPWRCRGDFDIVLVYQLSPATIGIPGYLLARLKRAPMMFWVQDLWPESLSATGAVTNSRLLGAVSRMVKWIYGKSDRVLVQSEAFFAPLMVMGVPRDRIAYLPNSAEAFYRPLPPRGDWNGPPLPEGFRVMFAGNVGAAQAFDTVLDAAERLRGWTDVHWVVVGDGRAMPRLRREVDRRGLAACVHLMGRHPVETMPAWFAQADVLLATLRRDPIFALTIPSKVQSYLACARPIVAALDGEGARIVEAAGAGFGVAAEDADGLADAVLRMYELSQAERDAMGWLGRDYFEAHFSRNGLLDVLEGWMKDLSGGGK